MLEHNIQSLKYADQITIINVGQIWSFWSFSSPKLSFAPPLTVLHYCFHVLSIESMWNWDQFHIIYVSNNM